MLELVGRMTRAIDCSGARRVPTRSRRHSLADAVCRSKNKQSDANHEYRRGFWYLGRSEKNELIHMLERRLDALESQRALSPPTP
jgi:hypothetical protein